MDGALARRDRGSWSGVFEIGGAIPLRTCCTALASLSWSAVRACAVTRTGDALCWGDSGRNGIDPPTRVKLAGKLRRIALGANHACALGVDGSVWCWGDGFYGATGTRAGSELPTSKFWTAPHRVL